MARRKLAKRSFADIDRGPLGGTIFEARKRRGATQAELAASIERDRPWLSDVETGKVTHVPDEDLAKVAAFLSLNLASLKTARDSVNSKSNSPGPAAPSVHSFTRLCMECGYRGEADARYCAICGSELPPSVACSHCGRLCPVGTNYCGGCGKALNPA